MKNKKEMNWFERFVILHNKLKEKKHIRKNQTFSSYDVGTGYTIILSIITWLLFGFSIALNFIILTIILYIMNYIEFNKKKEKE